MAGAVVTGLTNNPAFPAPTVDLKAVQAAVDQLNVALVAQAGGGGTTATAEKRNKQEALISLLRKLKHYAEDNYGSGPDRCRPRCFF